jgi:transposase InsO family protein
MVRRITFVLTTGQEFIEKALRGWIGRLGVKTLYIEPGSPWENGYCESFNSKLRDELLAREIFYTMKGLKRLSNGGEAASIRSARTHRWAIDRPRRKQSCQDRSCRLTFRAQRHERRQTTRRD